METSDILSVIQAVFKGADARDWPLAEQSFAPEVLYDYTSMAGGQPLTLTPAAIIGMWKQFLPGFDKTEHLISDFKITEESNTAAVQFTGHATHVIDKAVWIVEGTYETKLTRLADHWRLTFFKFNLQNQEGDLQLPALAQERASQPQR
ncbi:nuclear transport factor 2 family protein [Chitinophaga varians]|uniref:nuclear transport factor 2 family protein n=1 Tax=Chitinophaga varians TaxID=2202339 RepID=UPI00165F2A89|nr:nuclear transport factor 2 family protein [Chitinophaga varians]MBC9909773.1 nuclear transport factor 2 family protein [Chitinophaga varians]